MTDVNEIWAHASELGALIASSPEVEAYKRTQQAMESVSAIKSLLNRLRDAQTEYNRLESYGSGSHLQELEKSVNDLLAELDQYPEVHAFKQASAKVDELLRSVTTLLGDCITDEINRNTAQKSGSSQG